MMLMDCDFYQRKNVEKNEAVVRMFGVN